jgi:hypothetical protein
MAKALASDLEKAAAAWDPHDRLCDTERDELRVGNHPTRVCGGFWQEIVRCAINGDAEQVEVGVHGGLLVDGVLDTADFGLSVQNPFATAIAVESII